MTCEVYLCGLRLPTAAHDCLIASYLCFLHAREPAGIPWKPKVHLAVHLVLSAGRFGNPSSFTSQFAPSLHDLDVHNGSFLCSHVHQRRFLAFSHGGANITTEASAIRRRQRCSLPCFA